MTAQRFLPKVNAILQRGVKIISARQMFEQMYPKDQLKWKIEAFLLTRADMSNVGVSNFIVLGDSIFEMQAAQILGN